MNGDLNSWDKFCNYLWFDKKLNIWLDISKINFTSKEINNLEDKFKDVFSSIKELEMVQSQILMKIDKLDIIGLEIHQFHPLQK